MHTKQISKTTFLQETNARTIAGVLRQSPSDNLHTDRNISKIKKLYMNDIALCMDTYQNCIPPELFNDKFVEVTDIKKGYT